MPSQTKADILARHNNNAALLTPLPAASIDEPWRPVDERIIASAADALDDGQTHYVDVPGIMPLREAIANHLNANGASHEGANVVVTAGVQESRFLTIQKLGENYDSIGVPNVAHPGVQKALGTRRRNVVSLPVDDARCLPGIDAIAAALDGGCRLLYLESPSRLTGAAYSADEVGRIADLLAQHDAACIWDGGMAGWVDGGCGSLDAVAGDWTAAIGEAFPGAGLGAWLVGYIAAPVDWIPPMQSQKQIMAICTSTASQYAALGASEIHDESHDIRRKQLRAQREAAIAAANDAGLEVLPGAASNILAARADESARAKLADAGFGFADGADFGLPGVVRISVGSI